MASDTAREEIIRGAQAVAVAGEVACVDAHELAWRLNVSPLDVGDALSQASTLRFNRCQLGLFGYGPKAEGRSKIVARAAYVPDDIRKELESRSSNGRISCADVWEVADAVKYPRLGMANIVEALGLRVTPCQLGCF
ncbi:MAG: hypothetical protein ACYC5M_01990 [Anaerolineae bacterium]